MDFQQICIEKIEIQKFKKIRDLMLEPEAGANLIFGSYRCGKTSLCEFIQFALYGAGSVSLARENAEDALGKMILRADSVRFLIERSVIGGKEELTFSELDSGEAVQTDLTPGEYLTGLNQDSFDRITYFRQARFEAPYLKPKASFLKQLSSYQEDTKNLYQTLSEQETELFSYHNGQQNGSLDLLLAERDALQALVDERPKREEEIASISSTLQELGERIDENDRRRVLLKADMAAYTDDLKLSENKENAEEIHRSLQAKEKKLRIASYEVSNKIGKLSKAELEELRGDYNHLSLAVTGLAEARMALTSAEENLSFHERLFVGNDNPAHYTEEAAKIRKNKALRTLICLLGVLLMAGGVALFLLLNDADFDLITSVCAGSALVLCGIAALCVSTVFSGAIAKILQRNQKSSLHDFHEFLDRLRAHEKTTLVYREQVLRQEENCQRKSDEKDAVTQTIAKKVEALGYEKDGDLLAICDEIIEANDSLLDLEREIEDEKAEYLRLLSADVKKDTLTVSAEFQALQKELSFLSVQNDSLYRKRTALQSQLQEAKNALKKDPEESAARLAQLSEKIAKVSQEYDACKRAYNAQNEKKEQFEENIKQILTDKINSMLDFLLQEGESFLFDESFELCYRDRKSVLPLISMGGGVIFEMGVIAFRLSLAELLQKNSLPLIFDDSFAMLDPVGVGALYQLLQKKSDQFFIATSSEEILKLCRESAKVFLL